MFDKTLKNEILSEFENAIFDEPMSKHTTFKLGGKCDCLISASEENITDIISFCLKKSIDYTVIGNGSNILCSDDGYRGIIIKIDENMNNISCGGKTIYAQAGCKLSKLSNFAMSLGLGGLEFAGGIPGNLGGALYMNAGAYGGEMKNVVKSVKFIENGNIVTKNIDELDFGYRHTYFTEKSTVILSCEIECFEKDKDEIQSEMKDYAKRRRDKQPLEYPSAGSFFKRPQGYFAGKLIQDSGLMGYKFGGAQVSEKHAGFVINTGDALCSDVVSLSEHVIKTVYEKNGVYLEPEVRTLGFEFDKDIVKG